MKTRGLGLQILAALAAIAVALVGCGILLAVTTELGPIEVYRQMIEFGTTSDSVVSMINRSVPLYISGVAVAIGFKMGIFNIGVEGQYRIALLIAAWFGAVVELPQYLHTIAILLVAMLVGMAWMAVPAVLKVTRGVNEVISTIMLNAIAVGVGAWLFTNYLRDSSNKTLNQKTKLIAESGWMPDLFTPSGSEPITGMVIVAMLLGLVYYLLVWRTRFGYDLRASGLNPIAARISGVNSRATLVRAMLISGAVAGLVGMPALLSGTHYFTNDLPIGLGFAGIAVALLGRNSPIGIAIGALLFGFMDRSSLVLDLQGIPKEIVQIMQGIIVLSVVVAYEVVRRVDERRIAAHTARRTEPQEVPA